MIRVHECHGDVLYGSRLFGSLARQTGGMSGGVTQAQRGEGAVAAIGGFRGTDKRAQLHERLIEVARVGHGERFGDACGEAGLGIGIGDVTVVVVQSRKDAQHVSVHGRHRDPEADGRDSPRGIRTDPGQCAQQVVICRQLSAVVPADDLCGLLQIHGAAVVPESLPDAPQFVEGDGGKGGNVGQGSHEPLVIRQNGVHPGLLQHDLADPDMIRRRILPKRQRTTIELKPTDKRRGDREHIYTSWNGDTGERPLLRTNLSVPAPAKLL